MSKERQRLWAKRGGEGRWVVDHGGWCSKVFVGGTRGLRVIYFRSSEGVDMGNKKNLASAML